MGDKQGIRDRVAQKAVKHGKEVGKEVKSQVSEMGSLAGGALASKGWMYPIQGFVYLISHPALYTPVKSAIVSALTMSIMVVGFMFLLTYVPQAGFLALFTGPLWLHCRRTSGLGRGVCHHSTTWQNPLPGYRSYRHL